MKNAGSKGMIFLQPEHPIVKSMVEERLSQFINETDKDGKRSMGYTDTKIADFDGVTYQVLAGADKSKPNVLEVNLFMNDYKTVYSAGGEKVISKLYGKYKGNPISSERPDLCLHIDASTVNAAEIEDIGNLFGLLKRNVLGAPLQTAFEGLLAGSASTLKPTVLNIRGNEQMIILPKNDRVMVAVSFCMLDDADAAFTEQILDKMAGASKSSNGPNVKFTRDPPAEVSSVNGIKSNNSTVGFLLFTVSKGHVDKNNLENALNLILDVRHFVHYHIKASKAHLHQRMRAKVTYFLQVLNRAKPPKRPQIKHYRIYDN